MRNRQRTARPCAVAGAEQLCAGDAVHAARVVHDHRQERLRDLGAEPKMIAPSLASSVAPSRVPAIGPAARTFRGWRRL